MKIKMFLSMLAVIFWGLLAGASIDEDGNLSGWVWFILIAVVVLSIAAAVSGYREEEKKRERAAAAAQAREQMQAEEERLYNKWYDRYIAAKGYPDKMIVIEPNKSSRVIFVHEDKKKVFMRGKEYDFKEIMSCTFTDSPTTIKGKMTATTKSNTGSTVGRAIVGDIVAGPTGAIIGGTTGKKTTEFHQESDQVIHDYTVIVNVDSISNPVVRLHTGTSGKLTNEIVGLMNVIIARK